MQAIFGFGQDNLARWNEDVCGYFALAGELATPWRWINAGAEALGEWLLHVRGRLLRGQPIDLREAPPGVTWVELDGVEDHKKQLMAARVNPRARDGSVLIMGDSRSPDRQRQFASQTPGAVTVEAVDLRDLVAFARGFDLKCPDALRQLAQFAQTVMTTFGATDLIARIETLKGRRARKPATDLEKVALAFVPTPSSSDRLIEVRRGLEVVIRVFRSVYGS